MKITTLLYKGIIQAGMRLKSPIDHFCTACIFFLNEVKFKNFKTKGCPNVIVAIGGSMQIGKNFRVNNTWRSNPIGYYNKSLFFVDNGAKLVIGENVGVSFISIFCSCSITIKNNVLIGGGVCIYDTDFHPINPIERNVYNLNSIKKGPVTIDDNVFIGSNSTILKGVHIGKNVVIGASSLVSKSIPDNQVWAGNPAKFIRFLE